RLRKRSTENIIQFHCAPHIVFREREVQTSRFELNIQPDEGIQISFCAKRRRTNLCIVNATMHSSYREGFGDPTRSAYVTRQSDCVRGDATLFDRGDSVEDAWSLVDPSLDVWSAARTATVPQYAAGSWGPRDGELLLERDGRRWYSP